MVVCRMEGILSRLRNGDKHVHAVELSTRDDLGVEFQTIFPPTTRTPDYHSIPTEWCQALQSNAHVRDVCLYASFLDTVMEGDPTRHSRFAILMELFSHLPNLQTLELHAFSVPTRIFPVIPLYNLLSRQATSLQKLALYNIRSEGMHSREGGFRQQLTQAVSSMVCLEELVWEPFPLLEYSQDPYLQLLDEPNRRNHDNSYRVMDEALLTAIWGLPRLRRLSLCAKSVNLLVHPLQRLALSRPCLQDLWNKSHLRILSLSGFSLTSDDLRVLLGISKQTKSSGSNGRSGRNWACSSSHPWEALHLTQCLLEEPAAILEYLAVNQTLRRLVLTDTWMGCQSPEEQQHPTLARDPFQQKDFLQHIARILEYQNTTLHWVITRSPSDTSSRSAESNPHPQQLDTLLQLNRTGLRDFSLLRSSLVPQSTTATTAESSSSCPKQMWAQLLYKLSQTSPTVLANVLERNFEALFLLQQEQQQ